MSSLVELKYMVFHCVTKHLKCVILSWTEYSFLSKQSVMSVCRTASLLPLNHISELVCDSEVTKQGPLVTTALRTKEVLKMSQGCHTCNLTNQQPEVMHPAVCFLHMPVMKRKLFRMGHTNRSKHHPLCSGHGPLAS